MDAINNFFNQLGQSLQTASLSKITLSKARRGGAELQNVYGRLVEIKEQLYLSCTLRYTTRDETKNLPLDQAVAQIQEWLMEHFRTANLFTKHEHWVLQVSKKGVGRLQHAPIKEREINTLEHDNSKQRPLDEHAQPYLNALGIASQDGQILQQGKRKFRQINKYIELIEHLLREQPLPANARIVDMGSGKGYLTFALYDYLVNQKELTVKMTGIELREGLVEQCNGIAKKYAFDQLEFVAGDIHEYQPEGGIDMLIALHACDTATDEAIAKGIRADAKIIVVAPCCHKQVRKAMKPPADLRPMLQHGILLERQAEMLTDAIRSLLLEANGYKTKVFEFIGTEHTPKNVMITAVKSNAKPGALGEIETLKSSFGLSHHHLEKLLAG
jgi:hypothetical protein